MISFILAALTVAIAIIMSNHVALFILGMACAVFIVGGFIEGYMKGWFEKWPK